MEDFKGPISQTQEDKEKLKTIFLSRFSDLLEHIPKRSIKSREIKAMELTQEERVFYNKLLKTTKAKIENYGYFELIDVPMAKDRYAILSKLIRLGFLINLDPFRRGLENSRFGLSKPLN